MMLSHSLNVYSPHQDIVIASSTSNKGFCAVLGGNKLLVLSLHRYGPKAVTGWIPRPGRGRPTNPWLVGPRRTVL
jgi:hypothetical protein